jgi:hypothetical protein
MKKSLVVLIFLAVFGWGIYQTFNREDDDMKNVGVVEIISTVDGESKSCAIRGRKISKRYEDDIKEFELPLPSDLKAEAVTIEKPDVIDENNYIGVSYDGEYVDKVEDDMYYMIYDSDMKLLYKTDTLGIIFEKGKEYYVVTDVKWGKPKNYVCLRYCFRIAT